VPTFAATKVNAEMLRFYWSLGKDIYEKDGSNNYGSGFYKKISSDLRSELPDVKSFSVTNLHYMRWFYELYPNAGNLPQLGVDSEEMANLPQAGVNSESLVFSIPWGHNKLIIDKCKGNTDKALFFVKETMDNTWSRAVLMNFLDTDLYERKGKAVTNFKKLLPPVQSDLAQYAVNMINVPIGISEYKLSNVMPEEFKSSMPTIEEIENELKDR